MPAPRGRDDHSGEPCPSHQLPAQADLYRFVAAATENPSPPAESALAAFSIRVGDFYRSAGLYKGPEDGIMPRIDRRRRCVEIATAPRTFPRIEDGLDDLHRHWIAAGKPEPHPLTSLVRAWQRRQQPIEPDRRRRGIVPAPLVRREHGLDRLPDLAPPEEPGIVPPPAQDYLPRLRPDDDRRNVPALLALFDAATGSQMMHGGVHLSLAIFVEALLSVPRDAPLGLGRVGPFTIGEIAGDWLQWKKVHYRANKAGTGVALRKALVKVHNLAVPIGSRGGWYYPLMVRGVEGMQWEDRIAFLAEIIGGAQVGPAVDRHVLRSLRKRSTPAYRGYLSLCFDWDYYGGHQGRLALPTRPEVLRDSRTQAILDGSGKAVVGALVRNRDGTARRDRAGNLLTVGDRDVKAWSDPRAVRTGKRERNPQIDRYPGLRGRRPGKAVLPGGGVQRRRDAAQDAPQGAPRDRTDQDQGRMPHRSGRAAVQQRRGSALAHSAAGTDSGRRFGGGRGYGKRGDAGGRSAMITGKSGDALREKR